MENILTNDGFTYKELHEYKSDIDYTINEILQSSDNLVFANVAKKAGINEFVIRRYPELRNYILTEILKYKKKHVINCKIERVVSNLIKSKKNVSFVSVINKCKFSSEYDLEREYINKRIRELVVANSSHFKI